MAKTSVSVSIPLAVKTIFKLSGQFVVLRIPKDSPLRNAQSLFWGIRTNDEGAGRPNGFHALHHSGKIKLVAPARVERYGDDGRSVVLNSGETLKASAVILATGYKSSWSKIFDGA
jgi:glycine/D-amino acid oxidase-like deaminating enzyme